MYFRHSDIVWQRFPGLSALVFTLAHADRVPVDGVRRRTDELLAGVARDQASLAESDRPSIKAWRQAYSAMGLKPTQYRSAVEALLRRFRKDGTVPDLHPLVNLLNAYSMSAGLPIAAFDVRHVAAGIEVRPARGDERFASFGGEVEHPAPDEIVFADEAGAAHARRWVFRQAAASSVNASSGQVLVVIEGLHEDAARELHAVRDALLPELDALGARTGTAAILRRDEPTYTFDATPPAPGAGT